MDQILLTPARQSKLVEVRSMSALFVSSSDPARVAVRLHSSDTITGKQIYEVRALHTDAPFVDVAVEIFNPASLQSVTLPVSLGFDTQLTTTIDKR